MKRTWWVEGPTFCTLAFKPTDRILEIGCGTGYFTDIFFSPFVAGITAIDIDPRAIETARRVHAAKNVHYEVMDARKTLPEGHFFHASCGVHRFLVTQQKSLTCFLTDSDVQC